ncbi:hypothetical protein BDM02DRAFT_1747006 [Thelephora ganbajun]|uniref:Uncharacterized protein n=1 Tax=Thelephora ganbajun TaxID=370292 RepID=A0ACB6ZJN3_THEGA|nr:hypothetical protein BDM02DRAFT_1747006 [Thelephora ganbajun]
MTISREWSTVSSNIKTCPGLRIDYGRRFCTRWSYFHGSAEAELVSRLPAMSFAAHRSVGLSRRHGRSRATTLGCDAHFTALLLPPYYRVFGHLKRPDNGPPCSESPICGLDTAGFHAYAILLDYFAMPSANMTCIHCGHRRPVIITSNSYFGWSYTVLYPQMQ